MRSAWIEKRRGSANFSQLHFARQGVVTEEMVGMRFLALKCGCLAPMSGAMRAPIPTSIC
jgi:hypothetical protein